MDVYTWLTRPWPGSSGAVFFYELLLALCEFCLLIWEHLKKHPVCTCCDSLTMLLTFKLGNLSSVPVFCLCVHLWLYVVTPQSLTNNSVSFLTWGPKYQPDSPCMCPVGARGFLCLNKDETTIHTYTGTWPQGIRPKLHMERSMTQRLYVNLHLLLDWQQLQDHKPVGTSGVTD